MSFPLRSSRRSRRHRGDEAPDTSAIVSEPTTTAQPVMETPQFPYVDQDTALRLYNTETKFVPDGGPYDVGQSEIEWALPETVYTAIFIVPMCIHSTQRSEFSSQLVILLPQFWNYFAAVGLQITFVTYVFSMVDDMLEDGKFDCDAYQNEDGPTDAVDPILRLICVFSSVISILVDIFESISICQWIQQVPVWNEDMHKPIVDKCCEESGFTDFPLQNYVDEDGIEINKPAVGVTPAYRIFMVVFGVIPKFIIASTLLVIGTMFVAGAESKEDIILNAVSLVFLFEVDDLIFSFWTAPMFKMWITSAGVIGMCEHEILDDFWASTLTSCHTWITAFLTLGATVYLYIVGCSEDVMTPANISIYALNALLIFYAVTVALNLCK